MPNIVDVPGHGLVSFPDEMDDAAITAAIQRNLQPLDQPAPLPELQSHEEAPLEDQPENSPEYRSSQLQRPVVMSAEGPMTVKSIGVGDDQGQWVIPTVVDGKAVSNDEAIDLWKKGKNNPLNIYPLKDEETSNRWAQQFHEAEAQRISSNSILSDNLKKSFAAAAEGLTRGVGQVATVARRGLALLTGESITGAAVPWFPATADDTAKFHNDIADSFRAIEESTKGSTKLATFSKFAGSFIPIYLAGLATGSAGVLGTFFAQGYEGTREAAEKVLNDIDPDHTTDHGEVANKVGLLAGSLSAALAHYIHLFPGADKLSADAIEKLVSDATSKELGRGALRIGLQNTVKEFLGNALSQGAFTAGDLAVAKATYRPELTLPEAAAEVTSSMVGAGAFGASMRGAKEIVRGAKGFYPKAAEATKTLEQAKGDLARQKEMQAETAGEQASTAEGLLRFKAETVPVIGLGVPHAAEMIGRQLLSDGTPIGVIVGADPIGFTVHYNGQLQATTVPYAVFGYKPGVNIRTEGPPPAPKFEPGNELTTGSVPAALSPETPALPSAAPFVQRVKDAAQSGLILPVWGAATGTRPAIFFKVGNGYLPFYRSSLGTGGAKKAGEWQPFFGFGNNAWLIKGDNNQISTDYSVKEIADARAWLNANFNWPHELDTDLAYNSQRTPLNALGERQNIAKSLEQTIGGSQFEDVAHDSGTSHPHIERILKRLGVAPEKVVPGPEKVVPVAPTPIETETQPLRTAFPELTINEANALLRGHEQQLLHGNLVGVPYEVGAIIRSSNGNTASLAADLNKYVAGNPSQRNNLVRSLKQAAAGIEAYLARGGRNATDNVRQPEGGGGEHQEGGGGGQGTPPSPGNRPVSPASGEGTATVPTEETRPEKALAEWRSKAESHGNQIRQDAERIAKISDAGFARHNALRDYLQSHGVDPNTRITTPTGVTTILSQIVRSIHGSSAWGDAWLTIANATAPSKSAAVLIGEKIERIALLKREIANTRSDQVKASIQRELDRLEQEVATKPIPPKEEAGTPTETIDPSGAKFRIVQRASGPRREWTQTANGKRVGDTYSDGDPVVVVSALDKSTLSSEYTVKTYGEILNGPKNEVEIHIRDMTPDEIRAKQDQLRRENDMRRELGLPEEPIPEATPRKSEDSEPSPPPTEPKRPVGIRRRQAPLDLEIDRSKPLEAQRIQIVRLMDQMEKDYAFETSVEGAARTIWNQDRFDKLQAALKLVEQQLLDQSKRPPATPPSTGAKPIPEGFTEADVRKLLDEIEKGNLPLTAGSDLGIPSIQDFPNASHVGYGMFRIRTPDFEATFDAGGAMDRLPSGKGYTLLRVDKGTAPYDIEKAKAALREYLPKEPATAPVPEPEPAPPEPPKKPVGIRPRKPKAEEPTPPAAPPEVPKPDQPGYGDKNKIITKEQYEEDLKKMIDLLGGVSANPAEILAIGARMAVYHAEAGTRKFADWSKAMIGAAGPKIIPYLKSLYSGVRDYPGMDETTFDTAEEVNRQLAEMAKKPRDIPPPPLLGGGPVEDYVAALTEHMRKINPLIPEAFWSGPFANIIRTHAPEIPERLREIIIQNLKSDSSVRFSSETPETEAIQDTAAIYQQLLELYNQGAHQSSFGDVREVTDTLSAGFEDGKAIIQPIDPDLTQRSEEARDAVNVLSTNGDHIALTLPELRSDYAINVIYSLAEAARKDQFKQQAEKDKAEAEKEAAKTPQQQAIEAIQQMIRMNVRLNEKLDRNTAHDIVARIYGGTIGEGKFSAKDLSDIIEAAVNRHILETKAAGRPFWDPNDDAAGAIETVKSLKALIEKLPTQTVRTAETDKMQQFSTPPPLAYVAAWVAHLRPSDVVLEPSAGIGGLAVFPKSIGARVIANELSERRREILADTGTADTILGLNAEQINALMRPRIQRGEVPQPTVVLMNPPFSNAANVDVSNTMVGARHVEEALKLLPPGGRLVAIVGKGMNFQAPSFQAWWTKIGQKYNVRANIGVEGAEYAKYGTRFGNQILVIDNDGPTMSWANMEQGQVAKVEYLIPLLEGVRNVRPQGNTATEPTADQPVGAPTPPAGTPTTPVRQPGVPPRPGGGGGSGGSSGGGQGGSGAPPPVNQPKRPGKGGKGSGEQPGPGGAPPETPPGTVPGSDAGAPGADELTLGQKKAGEAKLKQIGVFTEYAPRKVHIEGAQPHPAKLVESTAMAAVEPVDPTYQPRIPLEQIKTGIPSDIQLENVVYAGQAHQTVLPNGQRMGYFIGDGTGVGKGVEISAILTDNWNQGRRKGVWISASSDLINDAKRDLGAMGFNLNKLINMWEDGGKNIVGVDDGIAFMPYTSLRQDNPGLDAHTGELRPPVTKTTTKTDKKTGQTVTSTKQTPSRMHLLRDWLGPDFDGVIVFDEAHKAGNALDMRGPRGVQRASQTGRAVTQLQQMFPHARIVYSSATGATELTNLSYADRLGIWGPGTPFSDKSTFFNQMATGGLSTMEMVARDLKSMGRYLARTLSYEGVEREQVQHKLTPEQVDIYNQLADGWQEAMAGMNSAMATTGQSGNGRAAGNARSAFFGAEQRFFNQVLTAMQLPTLFARMRESLEKGHSPVIQIVNTNEATLNRELARLSAEAPEEGNEHILEDMDLSPKAILIEYVRDHFPTQLYAPTTDANGNVTWNPVTDPVTGDIVHDPEALAIKQELLDRLDLLKAPGNPLDEIIKTFGEENVAEITGRSKRVVQKLQADGTRIEREEKRTHANREADQKAYHNDEKKILIFSDAGGTGFTFSSDLKYKNQRHRDHFGLQLGWRAANALQGFGRTHRSNQASTPTYYLMSTDLKGHQRFVSTIARRLEELGSITTGERKAAGGEMFGEMANLENVYAERAVDNLFRDLFRNEIPGFSFNDVARKLGFTFTRIDPQTGEKEVVNMLEHNGSLVESRLPTVQQFLNRILAMRTNDQNALFDQFFERLVQGINVAKQAGTYDPGTQRLHALSIRKVSDELVYSHPTSTAKTRLVEIDHDQPVKVMTWDELRTGLHVVHYVRNIRSQKVYALKEGPDRTDEVSGAVHTTFRRIGPTAHDLVDRSEVTRDKYDQLDEAGAKRLWDEAVRVAPKVRTDRDTYVVGAFLPIWDRLKLPAPRFWRIETDNGEVLLGAHVPERAIPGVRARLGAGRGTVRTPEQVFDSILSQNTKFDLANGWTLRRVRRGAENRIEVTGLSYEEGKEFQDFMGGIMERIQYRQHFFVPTDPSLGHEVMRKILEKSPIVEQPPPPGTNQSINAPGAYSEPGTDQRSLNTEQVRQAIDGERNLEGVRVHIIDNPDLSNIAGGFGYQNGKPYIFLNAAGSFSPEQVKQTLREEQGHALLSSPEGSKLLWRFAAERMTDADRESLSSLYQQRVGESDESYKVRLANEFIAKAGREKTGFWRELVERAKAFFAKLGFGQLTNEEAARAILRKLAAAARTGDLDPGSLPKETPDYSMNPVNTEKEYRKLTASEKLMDPSDAEFQARVFGAQNSSAIGHLRPAFEALPPEVKATLPSFSGRYDVVDAAQKDASRIGGNPWTAPTGDLRTAAQNFHGQPWARALMVALSQNEMMNLRDEGAKHATDTAEARKEAYDALQDEQQKIPAQRLKELGNEILNTRRSQVLAQRDIARQNNNQIAENAADRELEALKDTQAAIGEVIAAVLKTVPDSLLRSPLTPREDILKAWNARKGSVTINASPEVVSAVERTMANMPDLNIRLDSIKHPEKSKRVLALEKRAETMEQGDAFFKQALNDPQFKSNYEFSIDTTGSRGLVAKENKERLLSWDNPKDPQQSVTLRRGFSKEDYDYNIKALETAKQWFEDYLDPEKTPNPDPLKKAGIEAQLWAIDNIHISQQFNPKLGKQLSTGINPFNFFMRLAGGAMDVPDYIVEMSGGSTARHSTAALVNYAEFQRASQKADYRMAVRTEKATERAAESHKIEVTKWSTEIGDEIAGSYQNAGTPRVRVGMKVNGYTVNQADMDAVIASKAYVDSQRQASKDALQSPSGRGAEIKIRDVVGETPFEREAQPTSELTMPQRLAANANAFKSKWLAISEDGSISDAEKANQWQQMLDGEFLRQALIGHVRSFDDPLYAAGRKSPFRAQYVRLLKEINQTGKSPFHSLPELVDILFDSQQALPPEEQMTEDQIRNQVLKEINGAVHSFAEDESRNDRMVDPDRPQVAIISSENFMNRPRGMRLLPKPFYVYTVGTKGEQEQIRFHITEVFAQRLLNAVGAQHDALAKQIAQWRQQIKDESLTEEQILKSQKAGDNFLNLTEAEAVRASLERFMEGFRTYTLRNMGQEYKLYTPLNIARGTFANSILQRIPTMVANYLGPVYQKTLLDLAVMKSGKNALLRFSPIGATYATAKNAYQHAAQSVETLIGQILNQPEVTPKLREFADYLRQNKGYWSKYAAMATDYLERQRARVAELQDARIIDEDPFRSNIDALWHMPTSGGQLRMEKPTTSSKVKGSIRTAILLANELGLPFLQLPRALGVPAVEAVNNALADKVTQEIVQDLLIWSGKAFATRKASGYDPAKSFLTAPEVFGRKGARESDLAYLRDFFKRAGLNLDKFIIEHHQAVESGKAVPQTVSEIMGKENYLALVREMANYLNKGGYSNRPFYNNALGRISGLFLGYGINNNAQHAKLAAPYSRDTRSGLFKNADKFATAAGAIVMMTALGAAYQPVVAYLKRLFYKEEHPVRPLLQARSVTEAGKIDLQNMAAFLPLLGRFLVNTIGAAAPGTALSLGGFQLFPLSAANSIMQAMSKAFQTHSIARPIMELWRQFFPNSRVVFNRTPFREGTTTESSVRAILTANAPDAVEVKPNTYQTGTIQYGPARANVEAVVNALSRAGGPDMETVRSERKAGIDRLVAAGKTREDAEQAFDRSIVARNPFMAVYGRNLTEKEMADLRKGLSPDQLAQLDTVIKGRQAYAREYGRNEPDYIHDEGGGGGRAAASPLGPAPSAVGIRATGGGGGSVAGVGIRAPSGGGAAAFRVSPGEGSSGGGGGGGEGISAGAGAGIPRVAGIRGGGGGGGAGGGMGGLRSSRARIRGLRGARLRGGGSRGRRVGLRLGRNSRRIRMRRV